MTLPEHIYDFFVKINTGILQPILSGLAYILPVIMLVALIASVIWLIFASRKGPAIAFTLVLLIGNAYLNTLPTTVTLFNEWFGGNQTVDLSSATEAYNKGAQEGNAAIQGGN